MNKLRSVSILIAVFTGIFTLPVLAADKPNVIVIYSDDQGWGDVGFNGAQDVLTPNLDKLAADGTVFEQGYVSHPYCSPSRAGLLTGRYQQRYGHENNPEFTHDENIGLPIDEKTMGDEFKRAGYTTAAIGKWHLGDHKNFWPTNRGFDYWYGFSAGGMSFWGTPKKAKIPTSGVLENGIPVARENLSYLTDDFTNAGIKFINENKDKPFFMYLAYNAPHMPGHAPQKYLKHSAHIEDGKRAVYSAMVSGMDHGIGQVVETLKQQGLYENTLIVFASDNGGHLHGASSAPYRGHKGMLFEGGIRVPFTISWPGKIAAGKRYNQPVSTLDVLPTTLAAAGVNLTSGKPLDGVNLMPYLSGAKKGQPHTSLFWRYSDGAGYAIRHGDYKLVMSAYKNETFLFDMVNDPLERINLAQEQPNKTKQLEKLYQGWDKQMINALWPDAHLPHVAKEEAERDKYIKAAYRGAPKGRH
jgi:arylsulfatase A-like enzyme